MFCEKVLGFLSLFLVFQTILAIDLKSDDNFQESFDKKSNLVISSVRKIRQMDQSMEMRNRINISATTEWKANDVEITDQRINGSVYMKNIFTKKLFIRDGFVDKYQNNGQNGKPPEKARKLSIILKRDRTPRLEEENQGLGGIPLNKTQPKHIETLYRGKRRAEDKKRRRKNKFKNEEKKESSISDAILEWSSQTLKDGLRGGVRLWNKLKNQISDSFNNDR